jgi:uncharacterized membrane protein YtjA (UPF0391 family)
LFGRLYSVFINASLIASQNPQEEAASAALLINLFLSNLSVLRTESRGFISKRYTVTLHFGGFIMLSWAITFLVIALIAAVLGFTGVAVAAAGIAKLLFVVFLILFLVSLVAHLGRRSHSV